ncbi:hypothetical protein [Shewanella sp. Koi 1]
MNRSTTHQDTITYYFATAKDVDYSLLAKAKTKTVDITLKDLIITDKFYRVRSGRCWQLWVMRNGFAIPVMQKRGGCFVVSLELNDF